MPHLIPHDESALELRRTIGLVDVDEVSVCDVDAGDGEGRRGAGAGLSSHVVRVVKGSAVGAAEDGAGFVGGGVAEGGGVADDGRGGGVGVGVVKVIAVSTME